MALTKSTITGRVPLPTDDVPKAAELTFTLSALDSQGADVLPPGITARVVLDNGSIPAGFGLWRNTEGWAGTHYVVTAKWVEQGGSQSLRREATLGRIQVGDSASYTLANLLAAGLAPAPPGTFWSAITEAQYNAFMEAAADVPDLSNRIDLLEDQITTNNIVAATWASLAALTGTIVGQGAEVLDADTGTHTDPVSGATVPNAGRFRWTGSAWQRIGDTGLSGKASVLALDTEASLRASGDAALEASKADQMALDAEIFDRLMLEIGAGNPIAGPGDAYATIDLDETGRPVRALDLQGRPLRAYRGAMSAEAPAPVAAEDFSGRQSVEVDYEGRLARVVDVGGLIHEARRGRLLPVTNTGALLSAVAYGDSTTWGDELTARPTEVWTTLLGSALGIPITNRGGNGQRSNEVVARMGAQLPRATVTGGSIPASGNVGLTGLTDDVWQVAGGINPRAVVLITDGGQRVQGRMTRTGTSTYTFARFEPGEAIAATAIDVWVERGWMDLAAHVLLGMGINDEAGIVAGTLTIAEVQARYRTAVSACRGGITVWGILDRGPGEAAGSVVGDYIRAMEAWFAAEFGRNYCPVRRYLASQRALDDAVRIQPGFEPTPADAAAIAVNTVPPSFRFAGVHLNALGHRLQALCLERHLRIQFNLG